MSMSNPVTTSSNRAATTVAVALAGVGILLGGAALGIAYSVRRTVKP
jgi:hypothetical protein